MRLPTDQEMTVIELLIGRPEEEMYAWDMVKKADGGLSENSIYVVLMRMVARGLLTDRLESDEEKKGRGPKRRMYKVSAQGLAAREARLAAERIMGMEEGGLVPAPAGGGRDKKFKIV